MAKTKRRRALAALMAACLPIGMELPSRLQVVTSLPGQYRWIQGLVPLPDHTFLILDTGTHRSLIVSTKGEVIRQIGSIGQEPGALQSPSAISLDARDEIVVLDSDNYRVQRFGRDGTFISLFPLNYYSESFAVTSNGNIVVNSPPKGAVFSIYSSSGQLLRSGGAMLGESAGYPGHQSRQSSLATMSRAIICADRAGGFYVVYTFMPLVQRYSAQGELLWQKRLSGPVIDAAAKTFWHEPGAEPARFLKKVYGVQLPVVISAAAALPNGRLLTAVTDGTLIELAETGEQLSTVAAAENLPRAVLALAYQDSYLYLALSDECFRTRDPIRF